MPSLIPPLAAADHFDLAALQRAMGPEHPGWIPTDSGGGGLMVHSIGIDAKDPKKIMVGISSAGIFV